MGDLAESAKIIYDLIANTQSVVVLSGAGASADSGIPTFRGAGSGWWTGILGMPILGVLGTASGWEWSPGWINGPLYRRFFLKTVTEAKPNAFHRVIGRLGNACVLTQNVDGLHQKAGTPPSLVAELHGTVLDGGMCVCGKDYPCTECRGGGKWRPSALLFMDWHGRTQQSCTEGHLLHDLLRQKDVVVLVVGLSGQICSGSHTLHMLRVKGAAVVHVNPCSADELRDNPFFKDGDLHLRFGAGTLFGEIEKLIADGNAAGSDF